MRGRRRVAGGGGPGADRRGDGPDPITSALLIALSGASASFLLGSCWGVCQDIAGSHAGLVAGCMNTAGQVGAVLSPVILPYFKDPAVPLCIAGGLYLVGAACWLLVDPRRPIVIEHRLRLEKRPRMRR